MKSSRILFIIFGVAAPIIIGLLHTFAHYSDLITPEVENLLSHSIPIFGEPTLVFNSWGLMSFMMGAAFIIIGLLNLVTFLRLAKNETPPTGTILTMMLYLIFVLYAAHTFSAMPQFYGAIVGLVSMTLALFTSKIYRSKTS